MENYTPMETVSAADHIANAYDAVKETELHHKVMRRGKI